MELWSLVQKLHAGDGPGFEVWQEELQAGNEDRANAHRCPQSRSFFKYCSL